MSNKIPHWRLLSTEAPQDQLDVYDEMRRHCPVAHNETFAYSVFGHAELKRILHDDQTFSAKAGRHVSIPNGMDPPQHTDYRQLIERYFTSEAMSAFAPVCEKISDSLVHSLPASTVVEVMSWLAEPFAQQIQCAFMGWPDDLQVPLRAWVKQNQQAIAARDRLRLAELALAFDSYIGGELDKRRVPGYQAAPHDITLELVNELVVIEGQLRGLTNDELISIIRNWTVGELGTIAACVGILCHYLAEHVDLQQHLREHPEEIGDSVDEILRINPPLITNRRKTTQATTLAGFPVPADSPVTLFWAAANRDEKVFGVADRFDPEKNKANNLLYGAGVHQCPGAPLARLELNMLLEKLLQAKQWHLADVPPEKAIFPAGGFHSVHVTMEDL